MRLSDRFIKKDNIQYTHMSSSSACSETSKRSEETEQHQTTSVRHLPLCGAGKPPPRLFSLADPDLESGEFVV